MVFSNISEIENLDLEAIEKELTLIAQYHDQIEVLEKYIKR